MPRGLAERTRTLIDVTASILADVQPATVRGICYKLFGLKLIPDMSKRSTDKVSRALVIAREEGIILWSHTVDETRPVEQPVAWGDLDAYGQSVRDSYTKDRWADQPKRLILVSEKGTVGGLLRPTISHFGIPFLVLHGFGSATALNGLAVLAEADPRPLTILYVGDFDPSGRSMCDLDLPGRLRRYGGVAEVVRVAVTPEQMTAYGLSTFPAADKDRDARYQWFVETHGPVCCELDSVDPNVLRTLVENAIARRIDVAIWQRSAVAEAAELASLADVFANWPAA